MNLLLPLPVQQVLGTARPFYSCKDLWSVQYNDRGVLVGDTLKRELVIDYNAATWRNYLPEQNASLDEYPWMTFSGGTCQQNDGSPDLATVTLNYRQIATQDGEGGQAPGQRLPADYTEPSPNVLRVDIRRHPKWNTPNPAWGGLSLADFWDDEKQAMMETEDAVNAGVAGCTEYIVGSCLVTSHIFSWAKPTGITDLIGKRAIPPGEGGDINSWLIVTGGDAPQSGFWHRTLVYQYSDNSEAGPASLWEWLYAEAAL